jgi:predicted TIM-barrel fold metal-dependent hydrolase
MNAHALPRPATEIIAGVKTRFAERLGTRAAFGSNWPMMDWSESLFFSNRLDCVVCTMSAPGNL